MRKKEGMRQTDTKPLTRLITDEVEMINLHSTIWGTVHFVDLTRKWVSYFTAAFHVYAFYPRNQVADFTVAYRRFAVYPRNLCCYFTAVFRDFGFCPVNGGRTLRRLFAFCPRNRAVDFTAAFHDFGFCPRKLALYFTAAFSRYGFCRRKWIGRVLLNGLLFTAPYVGLCFIGRIIKKLKKH